MNILSDRTSAQQRAYQRCCNKQCNECFQLSKENIVYGIYLIVCLELEVPSYFKKRKQYTTFQFGIFPTSGIKSVTWKCKLKQRTQIVDGKE